MIRQSNIAFCSRHVFRAALRFIPGFVFTLAFISFSGCQKTWDEHYSLKEQSVNKLLWDEIQLNEDFSFFTEYIIANKLDTILTSNQQYTLFVPNNDAFSNLPDSVDIDNFLLNHLISPNMFSLRNIQDISKLQTLSGKFALIEKIDTFFYFDAVRIIGQSPVYLDGRYYEVEEFPFAKLSFNEYFKSELPAIYNYINAQVYDSLDKKLSTPIRIEDGKTIYDSVFISINPFENKYFPISRESRDEFATFILFNQEQYDAALDVMADKLGSVYSSHEDIPRIWQESILFPVIFDNGIFENALSIEQLFDPNLLNIQGEKVSLDPASINPESKIECSNGYIYEFYDFQVPDSLFLGEVRVEGESLLDSIGNGKFSWKEGIVVGGTIFEPVATNTLQASGKKCLVVDMGRSFSGNYFVEVPFRNIFPGRHRLEWRANYRPSGLYKIYINGEELTQYDTYNLRNPLISVTGVINRPTSAGINSVDFWVDNITEFGDVTVRFEYMGSGGSQINGFFIDYLSLIPSPL